MFLSEPGRTNYDLAFSLFGFPIRVHPAFFLLPVLLGGGLAAGFANPGVGYLIVTLIFFLSVLIHELGHAFAYRNFGHPARVVLYWMGGLAISDRSAWSSGTNTSMNPNQRMFVSFAGPLAGFLLAGVLVLVGLAMGGSVFWAELLIKIPLIQLSADSPFSSQSLQVFINGGILVNIFLNLFNLLPVYPLDGGQIAYQFMTKMDPRDGLRNSVVLSIIIAVLVGIVALANDQRFMGIFFGFMAYSNFQRLQFSGPRW